ncbi:putative NS2 [Bombus cryptarum densovirus]|uniref:putative NS2 n=1 Tax=Bombus cryptarum densovirus TaxID=2094261 RepID=UPI000D0BF271|nr:putative NS2 [Bombus cryptarum densovirus]AVH76853.1 putative NS2 [Bombus cryptarum densovirus]
MSTILNLLPITSMEDKMDLEKLHILEMCLWRLVKELLMDQKKDQFLLWYHRVKALSNYREKLLLEEGSSGNYSWKDLRTSIEEIQSPIKYIGKEQSEELMLKLKEWYKEIFEEQLIWFAITETTITLCTTAIDQVKDVAVTESSKPEISSAEQSLNELLETTASTSNTGSISQSISKKRNGNLSTWKSVGEKGLNVYKIEKYSFKEVSKMDKSQWWKTPSAVRALFVTSSPLDPVAIHADQVLLLGTKKLTKLPGVQKEERQLTSKSTYDSFSRLQ